MGFNSVFKGLKLLKTPGNGRLNNLNDPVINVLRMAWNKMFIAILFNNFALQYAIKRVQVNQDGLKLNGTHQLLVYANDVKMYMYIVRKRTCCKWKHRRSTSF
jgi:hypothetical protein